MIWLLWAVTFSLGLINHDTMRNGNRGRVINSGSELVTAVIAECFGKVSDLLVLDCRVHGRSEGAWLHVWPGLAWQEVPHMYNNCWN